LAGNPKNRNKDPETKRNIQTKENKLKISGVWTIKRVERAIQRTVKNER
jgi:hypothetical protein